MQPNPCYIQTTPTSLGEGQEGDYQEIEHEHTARTGEMQAAKSPDTMQSNPCYAQTTPTSLGEVEYEEIEQSHSKGRENREK